MDPFSALTQASPWSDIVLLGMHSFRPPAAAKMLFHLSHIQSEVLSSSKAAQTRINVNAKRPAVVAAAAAVLPAVRKNAARERLISNILNGRRLPDLSQLQKSISLYKVICHVRVKAHGKPDDTGSNWLRAARSLKLS